MWIKKKTPQSKRFPTGNSTYIYSDLRIGTWARLVGGEQAVKSWRGKGKGYFLTANAANGGSTAAPSLATFRKKIKTSIIINYLLC